MRIPLSCSPLAFTCLFILFLFPSSVFGGSFWDQFIDPKDGKVDMSQWLLGQTGFLPVPIIITEPAVGVGGGAALLFFHESKEDDSNPSLEKHEEDQDQVLSLPPSVSAAFGFATENGSWGGGGFHFGSWKQDRWRYEGGLFYGSFNLHFHGFGEEGAFDDYGVSYNIEGTYFLQNLKYRIGETDIFVGGKYDYLGSEVEFDFQRESGTVPNDQIDSSDAGLGLVSTYDTRDNIFTPNRGSRIDLEAMFHDEGLGGDFNYQKYRAAAQTYWKAHPDLVLGFRLDGRFTNDEVPFYALPYIDLRGIPAMRYQDEIAAMGEIEARWRVFQRWSLVGFTGLGRTANSIDDLGSAANRNTAGGGVRYHVARRLGIHAGFDVAVGPEDWAFYIQVGSAWSR